MTHPSNQEFLEAACRQHFWVFAEKGFSILHPHDALENNFHVRAISHRLQCVAEGKELRQMVLVPPRCMKSLLCSVMFPVWYMGNNPGREIMVISHNNKLAIDLANKSRALISDLFVQKIFPTFQNLKKNTESDIVTRDGGKRIAESVEGNVTGRGGHVIVMDDLLDASQAENENACASTNVWLDEALSTRMNAPAKTPMILVMQRLSVHDPVDHLQKSEDWNILELPSIALKDETIELGCGEVHHRLVGELLHEARLPRHFLDTQRKKMGKRAFEAQYQQRPTLQGGGLIDVKEFARYDKLPQSFDNRFVSVDPASGNESGSYTAFLFGRISNGRLFVEHVYRDRLDIAEQLKYLKDMDAKYIMNNLVVENSTPGKSLIELIGYEFRLERHLHTYPHYLQKVVPRGSKVERMEAAMNLVRQGRVLLPKSAQWLGPFENEIRAFPSGKNNDRVDALSQAIKFFKFYETDACNRIQRGLEPL